MRPFEGQSPGRSAKELANWTQASLFTVGNSLRTAGSSLLTGIKSSYDQLTVDHSTKERVVFIKFGRLEFQQGDGSEAGCPVLLLAYEVGFQIWSLKDAVREIASRRDGQVRFLEPMPLPVVSEQAGCPFLASWPLVAIISVWNQAEAEGGKNGQLDSCIKLYSLQSHSYVHKIEVAGLVLSAACSRRVLLVAMSSQVMAYNLATMAVSYSAITYPAPSSLHLGGNLATPVPLALGARWLAHASNQRVDIASGVATAQPIVGGHGRAASAGGNIDTVQHYAALAAKSSGRHIKSIGEAGYKYLSSQVDSWRSRPVASAPGSPAPTGPSDDADLVGTVVVRDLVSRSTLARFRAHSSPLLLLRFDGGGTLLVTASVHGHTLNIFHITASGGSGGGGSAVHLFQLSRGMTPALIQDVGFSSCGHWLCVSSARGTTHVFRLSQAGRGHASPPHLSAAIMSASERAQHKPTRLQPVGRARPRSGILNGSIPGSAAASAAVNLYNGTSGNCLVASGFLPQRKTEFSEGISLASSGRAPAADEDLFVVSNEGLLVRHCLSLLRPQQSEEAAQSIASSSPESEDTSASVAVEPLEQWDVCRRQGWPEREEVLCDSSESSQEAPESMRQQAWSAQAETSIPRQSGSLPVWMDQQFHILEMQLDGRRPGTEPGHDAAASTVLNVEDVPTRRIDASSRGGLAPVIIEGAETAVLRGAQLQASHQCAHVPLGDSKRSKDYAESTAQ